MRRQTNTPDSIRDNLDDAYRWVLSHSGEPIPDQIAGPSSLGGTFTKRAGFAYRTRVDIPNEGPRVNVIKIFPTLDLGFRIIPAPAPDSASAVDSLTWQIVDNVLGALNSWGRLYGFQYLSFIVFDGEQYIAQGVLA